MMPNARARTDPIELQRPIAIEMSFAAAEAVV
jgi:hypothetical protein